ncbi:bifunctional MaoC family dehydratase N-terminal/OB-fold nucleic acid binding domain-containing protein [Streptomyces sp. NPDC001315]|uniref:bifunctional MaoC family dehydratase N-terminal/OB-fold nucleic acid binding domain-containing protein n=1 Tax=Streptomyces sp. NPDC001315 TaxID=3364562 RepID=UPI0036CE567A
MSDEWDVRLKAYEGRPAVVAGVGKDPVNAPMIRHWCEAMGDTSPAYEGPEAVAPPTMLQVWTMGGLGSLGGHTERMSHSGRTGSTGRTERTKQTSHTALTGTTGQTEPTGTTGRTEAYDELLALLDEAGCTSVVATDCEQEYLRPLRPGDEVTFDAVIESVSERKTTKLGTGYFVTTRMDVRVGAELAGTHRFRILKYKPARQKPKSRRPRPVVNRDNAGFWEGVAQHRLLIQRCTGCGVLRHPWLPGCNACGCPDWDTVEASGEGSVYSYVVMHHPSFPAFTPSGHAADAAGPYAVGLIELAEGVRIVSNVIGVPYDKVRIGMPVRLEFHSYDDELVLPVFRAREAVS